MKITFYHTAAEARAVLGLPEHANDRAVEKLYPVLVNSYYLDLIDPSLGDADPILRQSPPNAAEIADHESSPAAIRLRKSNSPRCHC